MSNFLLVSAQVWVLFALVAVGAAARWARLVDDAAVKGIVNVLILLVTPSLIIDVFQRPFEAAMLRQLGIAFTISVVAHVAVICAAMLLLRCGDMSRRPVLRLAAVFSNAGFMGIPLEQAILGDSGVFFGITYVVTFNLFMWSWGLWQMQKENEELGMRTEECGRTNEELGVRNEECTRPDSLKQCRKDPAPHSSFLISHSSFIRSHSSFLISHSSFLVNPGTIGLAVGLGLFLTRTTLPQILAQPVKMMASLNTPLAMLVIGYYLAGAKFRAVVRCRAAYGVAAVRLVAYPLAFIAALYPLRQALDRDMMLALAIAASAPVAAMVTMFSAKFARDVDLSVGLVSGTTLLSIVTMPAIIAFAMAFL